MTRIMEAINKTNALVKEYDPSQLRAQDGRWTAGGALSYNIRASVAKLYHRAQPMVRDAMATTAAVAITQFNQSDMDADVVRESLVHLSHMMEVSLEKARDNVIKTLENLKERRQRDAKVTIQKAVEDDVARIDRAIDELRKLDLGEPNDQPKVP